MLVQVIKEAVKTKPPTVTTKVSLTGKYVVLSSDIRGVNISSKTKKDEMCKKVQSLLLESLNTEKFGFIVRTNCKDVNESDFEDILKEAHDMSKNLKIFYRGQRMKSTCVSLQRKTFICKSYSWISE